MVQNGSTWLKWSTMVQNAVTYSKILPNDPKCFQTLQNAPKCFQNAPKGFKMLPYCSKMLLNVLKRSKVLYNAPKWSKTHPKNALKCTKIISKWSKMLQKGSICSKVL